MLRDLTCILLAAMALAASAGAEPVSATNLTPFTAVLGQPAMRSAALPGRGSAAWRIDAALASHSALSQRGAEVVVLDGESTWITLQWRYQPAQRWQFSVNVPWATHQSGFMDSFVERWHDLLGVPNGQRDVQREDDLLIAYNTTEAFLALDRSVSGIGDIRVSAVYAMRQDDRRSTALRASVELPTGDEAKLTGNGAADFALDLLHSREMSWRGRPLGWHLQGGVLVPGSGALLPAVQRDAVAFGGAAVEWQWRPRLGLFAQTTLQSAPWDSDYKQLGSFTWELTTGIRWPGTGGTWHASISEDLRIDRSPDFVLRLGWSRN